VKVSIRPVTVGDAVALAALYSSQRAFLAPYEPVRPGAFFTVRGQRREAEVAVEEWRAGRLHRFVIEADGEIVGSITASGVVRGPFSSARIGYFVGREWNGRGVGSAAVSQVVDWAFGPAGLHRIEAATLVDNKGSQRVLRRNGFRLEGLARNYLQIAGRWRDHVLFARTLEDPPIDLGSCDAEIRLLHEML
jgi:ribosomal-protein-alanine N-acetyltransferase